MLMQSAFSSHGLGTAEHSSISDAMGKEAITCDGFVPQKSDFYTDKSKMKMLSTLIKTYLHKFFRLQ